MHFCLGCITEHKPTNWKKDLIVLILSIVIVALTPFVLGMIGQDSIYKIRDNSPYKSINASVKYELAKVSSEISTGPKQNEFSKSKYIDQDINLTLTTGAEKDKTITLKSSSEVTESTSQKFSPNDTIIIRVDPKINESGGSYYNIVDKFRVGNIIWLVVLFIILVCILAGLKGLSSLMGLIFSIIIIIYLLIPNVLSGGNIIGITMLTSVIICGFTFYAGHGFNKRTTISLLASLMTIGLATIFAIWAVDFSMISGNGSEEAFHLKTSGIAANLSLKGLLLCSMIIGSVGILDDVTTAQSIAIEEISKANPKLTRMELFWSGLNIGREHVISLVNTLAIAYIGSSMPLFIAFTTLSTSPIWVLLNDQLISEEIIRSIVGSVCLLLAIPISTALAARTLKVKSTPNSNLSTDQENNKKAFSFVPKTDLTKK